MIFLLAMIFAIIGVPTVVEAVAHPKDNLLRSTGQAIEESVVKPIEEAVFKPLELYFDRKIAEVKDNVLKSLLRAVLSWITRVLEVIRNIVKF